MFGTVVIVFREVLEMAVIIGIIAAATNNVPFSRRWIAIGFFTGLMGACLVAVSTDAIASLAKGMGQELFNAFILIVAVFMLSWHNIWMTSHGAQLALSARSVGAKIKGGYSESSVLMTLVGLAVLREGSETVLFLYGIASSETIGLHSMLLGGAIGGFLGVLVGFTIYSGLLRIPMRWFFGTTGILVLLMAAGMASTAAGFLIQADVIPSLASPIWDTSVLLPQNQLPGMLLHSLIGYDAHPAGMQVVFYILVLVFISIGMRLAAKNVKLSQPRYS